jgi:hypothetical protein
MADARFILDAHLKESGEDLGSSLDINHELYINLDKAGSLHIIAGRNKQRELVAYWIGLVVPSLNYKNFMTGYAHAYWVRPDYRGYTVFRFTKYIDNYLTNLKVRNIIFNVRENNRMGDILAKLGYRKIEEVYTKVLRDV